MNKNTVFQIDWYLYVPILIIIGISLVTLLSLNVSYFKSQLLFLFVGVFAYFLFSQINYRILKMYSIPIYIISILLFTLIFFIGIETRGAIRWVEILGFRLQFSELLKPFLAISLASYIFNKNNSSFRSFFQAILLLLPVASLIFLQPDLGDALIYAAVVFFVLFFTGYPFKYFISLIFPLFLILPAAWSFLHDYQRQRILTFINPGSDPLGTSYNAIQSVIAVGSGMFLGKGLGQGTQSGLRFLPERHTDFIFASISEQLGFVGALILLIALGFLIFRIYTIFLNTDDKFAKTFLAITFLYFLIQTLVNIGMNIGIVPVVGVTLPFVSYGGSSMLSNFIFLGFLTCISKSAKRREVLEIK